MEMENATECSSIFRERALSRPSFFMVYLKNFWYNQEKLISKNKTMKKTSLVVLLLVFGSAFQSQAANTNSNQGTKAGQTAPQVQGNRGVGNTIQTNEQNKVMNQGESNQIQTQEQNVVQTQDSGNSESANSKDSTNPSVQKRSQVANAVQVLLQIADRNGGIGQQVRVIAQNQNQNRMKLEQNVANIQSRGGFAKFFIGSNYGEIKDAQKALEQNREQIRQLNQIRTKLSNQGDQQQLTEQIKALEQANLEIENSLTDAQNGFSLFGWFNKLVS
jgi:hypothetical protein